MTHITISELSRLSEADVKNVKNAFEPDSRLRTRDVTIYLTPLRWQLWPVWSKRDPTRISLGPLVITWSRC